MNYTTNNLSDIIEKNIVQRYDAGEFVKMLNDEYGRIRRGLVENKNSVSFRLLHFVQEVPDLKKDIRDIESLYKYILKGWKKTRGDSPDIITRAFLSNWSKTLDISYSAKGRERAYAVAFALELTVEQTAELFRVVYLERFFDSRNLYGSSPKELIWRYCLDHKRTWNEAELLISCYEKSEKSEKPDREMSEQMGYSITRKLNEAVLDRNIIKDDTELVRFLCEYTYLYDEANNTALRELKIYIFKIMEFFRDRKNSPEIICEIADVPFENRNLQIILNSDMPDSADKWKYRSESDQWLNALYRLVTEPASLKSNVEHSRYIGRSMNIANLVKESFPSIQTFRDKIAQGIRPTYQEMKKQLTLCCFYYYWCVSTELEMCGAQDNDCAGISGDFSGRMPCSSEQYAEERLYNICCSVDNVLLHAGYPALYVRNPFDYVCMYSSLCDRPIKTFHDIIAASVRLKGKADK